MIKLLRLRKGGFHYPERGYRTLNEGTKRGQMYFRSSASTK
jgi:hypothetical protein